MSLTSENLQLISQRLSAAPFEKNYSMVQISSLPKEEYIQLLNEIIYNIDQKQATMAQCKSEAPEARVIRHLGKVLFEKYY